MTEKTVTITEKEYDRLLKDSCFLGCLEAAGVDNWDWYYEAFKDFRKKCGLDDDEL